MMGRLTLVQRFILAVGSPLLGLLVVAWLGIFSLRDMNQEFDDLATEDMPIALAAERINSLIKEETIQYQRIIRSSYVSQTGDPAGRVTAGDAYQRFQKLEHESENIFKKANQLIKQAQNDQNPKEVAKYVRLEKLLEVTYQQQLTLKKTIMDVAQKVVSGNHSEALTQVPLVKQLYMAAGDSTGELVHAISEIVEQNQMAAQKNLNKMQ